MAHAMKSSLFSRRLEQLVKKLAAQAEIIPVTTLPTRIRDLQAVNAKKLAVCQSTLSADCVTATLTMLNDDWQQDLSILGKLTHWCQAGCCKNEQTARNKIQAVLEKLLLDTFEVPLLYRWKHVEPAAEFTLRGLLVHRVLEFCWRNCLSEQLDEAVQPGGPDHVDIDEADLSPAEKQKVRATKVLHLLSEPEAPVTWMYCMRLRGLLRASCVLMW